MQKHRVHWPTLSWWFSLSAGMASRGMPPVYAVHNFSANRSHLAEDSGVHWQSCSHTSSSSHFHDPRPQRHESQHRQELPCSEYSGLLHTQGYGRWSPGWLHLALQCIAAAQWQPTDLVWAVVLFNCLCFSILPSGLGGSRKEVLKGSFPRVAHTQCVLCSGQKVKKGSTHWARKIIPSFGAWKEKESLWICWAPVPELFLEN